MSQLNRVHIAALLLESDMPLAYRTAAAREAAAHIALQQADDLIVEHLATVKQARKRFRDAYKQGTPGGCHEPWLAPDGEVLSLVGPTDNSLPVYSEGG